MLTLRKTWVKDSNPVFHVPNSQPMTDLGLIVPYSAFRPLAKVSEETPTTPISTAELGLHAGQLREACRVTDQLGTASLCPQSHQKSAPANFPA